MLRLCGFVFSLPLAVVGSICIWLAGERLRGVFLRRLGVDAEDVDKPDLQYTDSWLDLGIMARDLFDAECLKRNRFPEVEVTETRIDMDKQVVSIHFRLMNPDEDCGDLRNAMAQSGGFAVHPTIQAHIDSKRIAMERNLNSQRIRRMKHG